MSTSRNLKRKQWRCFHCDEVFTSRKEAYRHFGPDEQCEKDAPACIDPLRYDEKARLIELREAQDYAFRCQESANELEDKFDQIDAEFAEFKKITGCDGLHELRMWMDSQKGIVVSANALIDGFRAAAPELAAQIIG